MKTLNRWLIDRSRAFFFSVAAGPHGHPNAAAAFGSHARLPRVGPALGTPPGRRDLSLTPRLGFSCPRLGVAAGALSESNTRHPKKVAYKNFSFRDRRFAMVVSMASSPTPVSSRYHHRL